MKPTYTLTATNAAGKKLETFVANSMTFDQVNNLKTMVVVA